MIQFLIISVILIITAMLMIWYLSSCSHKWKHIRDYDVKQYSEFGTNYDEHVYRIYECEHCKKIKKTKLI